MNDVKATGIKRLISAARPDPALQMFFFRPLSLGAGKGRRALGCRNVKTTPLRDPAFATRSMTLLAERGRIRRLDARP